ATSLSTAYLQSSLVHVPGNGPIQRLTLDSPVWCRWLRSTRQFHSDPLHANFTRWLSGAVNSHPHVQPASPSHLGRLLQGCPRWRTIGSCRSAPFANRVKGRRSASHHGFDDGGGRCIGR